MTASRLLPLAAAALLAAAPARAQSVPEQPTVITSDALDMRSTDKETTSIFTGNVVVTATNLRLTCDRLEVVAYRQHDPAATIGRVERFKSLVAEGNVRIVQGDREAACGRAEVLPGEERLVLREKPVLVDRAADWTYTGEELVLLRGERQVKGTKPRLVGPALKDLGVDRDRLFNEPAPAPPASKQE
jgi:lipopolysaccharide export system protein LptA